MGEKELKDPIYDEHIQKAKDMSANLADLKHYHAELVNVYAGEKHYNSSVHRHFVDASGELAENKKLYNALKRMRPADEAYGEETDASFFSTAMKSARPKELSELERLHIQVQMIEERMSEREVYFTS